MKKYARIDNGVVAELLETDGNIEEMFHPDIMWVDVTNIAGVAEGYLYKDGLFSPPQSVGITWQQFQQEAMSELNKSDITVLRCYEDSISVPKEWKDYRKSLREIVSSADGDPMQLFPVKPASPQGS